MIGSCDGNKIDGRMMCSIKDIWQFEINKQRNIQRAFDQHLGQSKGFSHNADRNCRKLRTECLQIWSKLGNGQQFGKSDPHLSFQTTDHSFGLTAKLVDVR